MDLRITPQTQLSRQVANLRRQSDTLARLHEQASSGLKLLRPSDDPIGQAALMRARGEDTRLAAQQDNIGGVRARLEQANSNLLDANKLFTRARELALDGANDGTDASAFETMAGEVDRLLDRLLTLANGQADGRSLFAGTATGQAPFVVSALDAAGRPATITYQGTDQRAVATVGRGQQVDMLYSGEEIFQKPGQDAFGALIGLRDLLRNTTALPAGQQRLALSQQVGTLEAAQKGILDGVGELSAGLLSLQALSERMGDLRTQATIRVGELESADIAEVVVNLTAQQTLLGNTLQLAARTYDMNLLDLLR